MGQGSMSLSHTNVVFGPFFVRIYLMKTAQVVISFIF